MQKIILTGLALSLVSSSAFAYSGVTAQAGGTVAVAESSPISDPTKQFQTVSVTEGPRSASATADLAAGLLRGNLTAAASDIPVRFTATISDRIFLDIAGARPDTLTQLFLGIRFEGEIEYGGSLSLTTSIREGGGTVSGYSLITLATEPQISFSNFTGSSNSALPYQQLSAFSYRGEYDYLMPFTVHGATPFIDFHAIAEGRSASGWSTKIDFGNSAHFNLVLPQNVSFTSASGVALTGGAVPEPATWALMIGGFGLAGASLRRRQRTYRLVESGLEEIYRAESDQAAVEQARRAIGSGAQVWRGKRLVAELN